MKRNLTKELSYLKRTIYVKMEDLPVAEAGQLALCVALLNEWKEKCDNCKAMIEKQRLEILHILKSVRKVPSRYDYCLYTEQPELYGDLEGQMPDNIILTTTHGHTQMRFDVKRFKECWPGIYTEFLRQVKHGTQVLTGKEIMNIIYNEKEV